MKKTRMVLSILLLSLWCALAMAANDNKGRNDSNANLTAGQKFLAQNRYKAGVVTLPNGLQYKILTKGTGPRPSLQDSVKVYYELQTIDGRVIDSTLEGRPVVLSIKNTIPGWQNALTLMHVGATWNIYVPSKLAYGERGVADVIPPNSVLIFQVELLGIVKHGVPAKQDY